MPPGVAIIPFCILRPTAQRPLWCYAGKESGHYLLVHKELIIIIIDSDQYCKTPRISWRWDPREPWGGDATLSFAACQEAAGSLTSLLNRRARPAWTVYGSARASPK